MEASSRRLSRKEFVRDCIGRILTAGVLIESIKSGRTVNRLLHIKDRMNRGRQKR